MDRAGSIPQEAKDPAGPIGRARMEQAGLAGAPARSGLDRTDVQIKLAASAGCRVHDQGERARERTGSIICITLKLQSIYTILETHLNTLDKDGATSCKRHYF